MLKKYYKKWAFDFKDIVKRLEVHRVNVEERRMGHLVDVDRIGALYRRHRALQTEVNVLRQQRHLQGQATMDAKELKDRLRLKEVEHEQVEDDLYDEARKLPNLSSPQTPRTPTNSDNLHDVILYQSNPLLKILQQQQQQQQKEVLVDVVTAANMDEAASSKEGKSLMTTTTKTRKGNVLESANDYCRRMQYCQPGSAVSEPKSLYFQDDLVFFELQLVQLVLKYLKERHGFSVFSTPEIVKQHIVEACGFQPRDSQRQSQIYNVVSNNNFNGLKIFGSGMSSTQDLSLTTTTTTTTTTSSSSLSGGLTTSSKHKTEEKQKENNSNNNRDDVDSYSLIATSEIPLAALHMDQILKESDLPIRMAGLSHCFRTEAGQSKAESGLYRLHQFTKCEMFVLSSANSPSDEFNKLLEIQKEIVCISHPTVTIC